MNAAIVCPDCHSGLQRQSNGGLTCASGGHAFPKRSDVDVLLNDSEWDMVRRINTERSLAIDVYLPARRFPLAKDYYDWWTSRMWSKIPSGTEHVLELMCGGMELGSRMPTSVRRVACLDLNAKILEQGVRELGPETRSRIEPVCGTAARLPFPEASFDTVFIMGGLHHVRPILKQVLGEAARVLKPGGRFIASEPANDNWLIRAIRHWQYRTSPLQGKDEGEDGFTQKELTAYLGESGMILQDYERFGFVAYPLLGNMDLLPALSRSRNSALGRWLIRFDEALEKVPILRNLAWANIFTATKPKRSLDKKSS